MTVISVFIFLNPDDNKQYTMAKIVRTPATHELDMTSTTSNIRLHLIHPRQFSTYQFWKVVIKSKKIILLNITRTTSIE